ncbi:hypothetical protein Ancab_007183 [Ancistrocladus abbreviatus]
MNEWMKFNHLKLRMPLLFIILLLSFHIFTPSFSLNNEGLALLRFRERVVSDPLNGLSNWKYEDGDSVPCSWFGVECSDGKVVILNLKDFCLEGTLAPELGKLAHLRVIILRNNSFSGAVPREITELKELEVLDLSYNNFNGPLPFDLGNDLSLAILLLDNNKFIGSIPPELYELQMLSEYQLDKNKLVGASSRSNCNGKPVPCITDGSGDFALRRLLEVSSDRKTLKAKRKSSASSPDSHLVPSPSHSLFSSRSHSPSLSPSPFPSVSNFPPKSPSSPASAPSPSPLSAPSPSPSGNSLHRGHVATSAPSPSRSAHPPIVSVAPTSSHSSLVPSPHANSIQGVKNSIKSKHHWVLVLLAAAGGSLLIIISAIVVVICRNSKVVMVKPWATGLSGQLQKAFVSGVPKLKKQELDMACEDFSNIIGSLSDGTVYKGTLSSGVEIAVVSSTVKSREHWSRKLEARFRKKIETLSKVNHKNFVNLLGHCEEDEPFTRMMVFEYAPNGTLFEHLHIKEAERLDWGLRLRIIMGIAYCLEHMHQISPPIAHRDLQSSSIYLTEDYAAKVSDFSFWNKLTATKMVRSPTMDLLETTSSDLESNVYNFGVILLETITARIPYSVDGDSLAEWALECIRGDHLPREAIDPTLTTFQEDEVQGLFSIIQDCVHPNPEERPAMREITARLKEITEMSPDGAIPKLSPLWWAELEILSTEGV